MNKILPRAAASAALFLCLSLLSAPARADRLQGDLALIEAEIAVLRVHLGAPWPPSGLDWAWDDVACLRLHTVSERIRSYHPTRFVSRLVGDLWNLTAQVHARIQWRALDAYDVVVLDAYLVRKGN